MVLMRDSQRGNTVLLPLIQPSLKLSLKGLFIQCFFFFKYGAKSSAWFPLSKLCVYSQIVLVFKHPSSQQCYTFMDLFQYN